MNLKNVMYGLFVMCAMAIVGCKAKSADLIVKKWKATDLSGERMTAMSDSMRKVVLDNITIEFTKDGKYTTASGGSGDNGTYTISDDGKNLTMTSVSGRPAENSTIEDITNSKLVLIEKTSGTKITLEAK